MYGVQEKVHPEKVHREQGVSMESKRKYLLPEKVHVEEVGTVRGEDSLHIHKYNNYQNEVFAEKVPH